jgi:hypothetical protein
MRSAHLSPDMIIDGAREDSARLGRELARRIVHASPDILDDQVRLGQWLTSFANRAIWPDPKILSLHQTFSRGTEFERRDALQEFRAFLQEHMTDEPLTIVRVRRVSVGPYNFDGRAFPLRVKGDVWDFAQEMWISWQDHPSVTAVVPSWRSIDRLAMPEVEAEAFAKRLEQTSSRLVDVAMRMTLSDFRIRADDIVADASIEDVSVHFIGKSGEAGLGEFIANLPFGQIDAAPLEAVAAASSTIESWRRLGAPVDGDTIYLRTYLDDDMQSMSAPLDLLALERLSGPSESMQTAYYFSRRYTERSQFESLFGEAIRPYNGRAMKYDEFLYRDIQETFNRDYLPSLVSRAPQLPVNIRLHWRPQLGSYDFENKSFSILHGINTDSRREFTLHVLQNVPVQTNISGLPSSVPIEEDKARALRERAWEDSAASGSSDINVHAVMDLRLVQLTSSQQAGDGRGFYPGLVSFNDGSGLRSLARAEILRIALYEDASLTRLIVEFPLDELLVRPPEPEGPVGESLPDGLNLTRWNVLALAAGLGAGNELVEEAIRASKSYREVDAANRHLQLARMKAIASEAFPDASKDLYLHGTVSFGDYDPAAGLPISAHSFSVLMKQDEPQVDEGLTRIVVQNEKAFSILSMDAAKAAVLTRGATDRSYSALFRVRPVSAAQVPGSERPLAALTLAVESVVILHPDADDRMLLEIPISAPEVEMSGADDDRLPHSRFAVLGVRLGMPIGEARDVLAQHIAASPATPLARASSGSIGIMSPCDAIAMRAKSEGVTQEEAEDRLRNNDCPLPEAEPLVFAFGYDLQLSENLTERLIIYRTGEWLGEPVVSAISRRFSPGAVGTLLETNLPKQYGDDFIVPDKADNQRIWVDNPSQRALFQQDPGERCVPFWIGDHGFPAGSLLHDCGAFLRAESYRLILMDSGFAARTVREQQENAAVAKEKSKPEIRF